MREIKFRAWDRARQIMADVTYINFEANIVGYAYRDGSTVISSEEIELMEYTGLDDVNGKPIYEGDVVLRINEDLTIEDEPMLVKYRNEGARFTTNMISVYQPDGERKYKVIGNKFKNPELLEVAE